MAARLGSKALTPDRFAAGDDPLLNPNTMLKLEQAAPWMYRPLEVQDLQGRPLGKFFYVRIQNETVIECGHCAQVEPCPACDRAVTGPARDGRSRKEGDTALCDTCHNVGWIEKPHACEGHDTEDGARAHFLEYLLDVARYDGRCHPAQPCYLCNKPTTRGAYSAANTHYALCRAHNNRAGLAACIGDNVDRWVPQFHPRGDLVWQA